MENNSNNDKSNNNSQTITNKQELDFSIHEGIAKMEQHENYWTNLIAFRKSSSMNEVKQKCPCSREVSQTLKNLLLSAEHSSNSR